MYHVQRFLDAQEKDYATALEEIKRGRKMTHWIWYIFPQLRGLGRSYKAQYYGIENLDEAKEYLANETLRARLIEISEALLAVEGRDILYIMGSSIDRAKVLSSMTLFHMADPTCETFTKVVEKYFGGQWDITTANLCRA